MLTITQIEYPTLQRYCDAMTANAYFAVVPGFPPSWYGRGAEAFGVSGAVESAKLSSLFNGADPLSGLPLLEKSRLNPAWFGCDLNFDAGKYVSFLRACLEPADRELIDSGHVKGVEAALDYLDKGLFAAESYGRLDDRVSIAAPLAMFTHQVSGTGKTSLHTHVALPNIGVASDGTPTLVDIGSIRIELQTLDSLYQSEMAAYLKSTLGLNVRVGTAGLEVEGMPSALINELARLTAENSRIMEKAGIKSETNCGWEILHSDSNNPPPRAEFFSAKWKSLGNCHGFGTEEAKKLLNRESSFKGNRDAFTKEFASHVQPQHNGYPYLGSAIRAGFPLAVKYGVGAEALFQASANYCRFRVQPLRLEWSESVAKAKGIFGNAISKAPRIRLDLKLAWKNIHQNLRRLTEPRVNGEFRRLYPSIPEWTPARRLVFRSLHKRGIQFARGKWGETTRQIKTPVGLLSVRERYLFPNNAENSFLGRMKLKSLHLDLRKPVQQYPIQTQRTDHAKTLTK